ncbi:hypothetical protein FACS189447_02820 [Spirochaetia bacterium]|nr:hypothetical protein FACS189447_02820 [Spirochaetia bacterium]
MSKLDNDRLILRELAKKTAEIASLPIQEEKKRLWRALNGLKPERPMVTISQVCWSEMNIDNKLTLRCQDKECRSYENNLRRLLFQWEYFPADMVVVPYIGVSKAIGNTGFGISVEEDTIATSETNDVVSHHYENQFKSMEDVEKVKIPVITYDEKETARRLDLASWLFDGIIPVRLEGYDPSYLSIWDKIAMWMSVEDALYAIIDQSDMIHGLVKKMLDAYMIMLDQMEDKGLLCGPQPGVHCTGAYTDELPAPGYNPDKPRTKDLWMFSMAQMLATVSPAMHEEFDIDYLKPICERFGMVYYGCCEPLHHKIDIVRKLPNVRKISMSPWADKEKGAEAIHGDFVFSNKPNPAFAASPSFDGEHVRKDLKETIEICKRYKCPVELIFKDISTVRHEPLRLQQWEKIAMETVS